MPSARTLSTQIAKSHPVRDAEQDQRGAVKVAFHCRDFCGLVFKDVDAPTAPTTSPVVR